MIIAVLLIFTTICSCNTGSEGASKRSKSRPSEAIDTRPTFRPTSANITVGPGDRAVLKCRVDNLGTKTVTWRKHEDIHPLTIGLFPFVADTRISVDYNQRVNEWSLIIQDIRPSDEGLYHCQISTKEELDNSYDISLTVKTSQYQPRISAVQVSGSEYVERGNALQLICNATGRPDPPHNVEWYKDGEKVNSDAQSGVIITKKIETRMLVSVLVIRQSVMTNSGVYVCRSSNRDAGMITVQVLNVAATVEKRGTSAEKIRSCAKSETTQPTILVTALLLAITLSNRVYTELTRIS